jgi:peptidoglycan hydrolase CwlO-like protein
MIARNASLMLLAILILLSNTLTMVSANSLSVKMNKSPPTYNIGDSISISGTATPNASVSIKILDPNNTIKVESEVNVASNGNYSVSNVYTLKVTDVAGTWRVNVSDLSSHETAEAVFNVVAIEDRLKTLEDQLTSLQNQVQTLNGTIETLETSVEDLSSRLSAAETLSATLTMYFYGAIATSIASVALSIVAITQYLKKRSIYNRLTGKTKKAKRR